MIRWGCVGRVFFRRLGVQRGGGAERVRHEGVVTAGGWGGGVRAGVRGFGFQGDVFAPRHSVTFGGWYERAGRPRSRGRRGG